MKRILKEENMNFPRVDFVFNLDSPSTKTRIIHDFTKRIPGSGTTLSLEILSSENVLGSLVEAAFSFWIYPFI